MRHAVIVAHGQPSNPEPADAALAELAGKIDGLCENVSVHSATLAAPNALEACLDELTADTLVYPLFMARGWFVTSALPKRIGTRQLEIMEPLGTDPDLPSLVADALRVNLSESAWRPEETDLVIAAHGSGRSANPGKVAHAFSIEVSRLVPFREVRVGFVEQSPSITEAADGLGKTSICLPFFACRGGHVLEDIPTDLAKASFAGQVMPVIGELPEVQRQIARRLDSSANN